MAVKTPIEKRTCQKCGTVVSKTCHLARHRASIKCGGKAVKVSCDLCAATFSREDTRQVHRKTAHFDQIIQCSNCPEHFSSVSNRETHYKNSVCARRMARRPAGRARARPAAPHHNIKTLPWPAGTAGEGLAQRGGAAAGRQAGLGEAGSGAGSACPAVPGKETQ